MSAFRFEELELSTQTGPSLIELDMAAYQNTPGFRQTSFPLFQASRLLMGFIFDSFVVDWSHMFGLWGDYCCGVGWPARAVGHNWVVAVSP